MDNGTPEGGQESGGSLREKLEAALQNQASLATELASYKARDLIAENGYKHVTAEDLKDVKLDEIATKAAELEASKASLAESVLRTVLKDKFGDGADLDTVVKNLIGDAGQADTAALDRIRSVGKTQGLPAQRPDEDPNLIGPARLRAAFGA
jgi:hypothetical protein